MSTHNIYLALANQLDRLARHSRQGSFHTRLRYYEAMKRFCLYLAMVFHLQKLSNISAKHFVSYVVYLQDSGKAASTIKTDLAAIRFFHDKMEHARYHLPSNDTLGIELEQRRFGGVDRTWSGAEFHRMIGKAMVEHRDAVADEGREANLTFHGLRHSYAAEKYQTLIDGGMSTLDSHFTVSRLLGHERGDVTNIYLASVRKVTAKTTEGRDGE